MKDRLVSSLSHPSRRTKERKLNQPVGEKCFATGPCLDLDRGMSSPPMRVLNYAELLSHFGELI